MTIKTIKSTYRKQLAALYPTYEIDAILKTLCEDLLGWTKIDFILKDNEELTQREKILLQDALTALLKSKPVQHITGKAHFYGNSFQVNRHTLVPRQETEELVYLITKATNKSKPVKILDIGSGSGCIGITLALELPQAQVTLLDVSRDALDIAIANAKMLHANVSFMEQNILSTKSLGFYDIVVSNPPYVRELEQVEIHKNVLDYEPHLALFVTNEDPLLFYRTILQLTKAHKQTTVYFEINQYLGTEMQELAGALCYKSIIIKDLNTNDRMMKCWQD